MNLPQPGHGVSYGRELPESCPPANLRLADDFPRLAYLGKFGGELSALCQLPRVLNTRKKHREEYKTMEIIILLKRSETLIILKGQLLFL
jgi:hypothetical protein